MSDNTIYNGNEENPAEQPHKPESANEGRSLNSQDGQANPATSSGASPPFYPQVHQAAFVSTLFPAIDESSFLEVRYIQQPRGRAHSVYFQSTQDLLDALPKTVGEQNGEGVFIGVCFRVEQNGSKRSVKCVGCLWTDLDGKDFDEKDIEHGKQQAWQRLSEFPLRPSLITDSGNGFHAYWLLDAPISIQSKADITRIEGFNRRLASLLNGDSQSAELARVLRLPGTWNLKEPSCPLPARICECEPERRYSLSDFDWLAETERERSLTNGRADGPSHINPALSDAIKQIKAKANIVSVVGQRISLDANYKAHCPFHDDTNPSFSVHPQGQYFHCFGCGAGGDVFTFVQRYDNKPFMEAVSQLAQDTGVQLPNSSKPDVEAVYRARFEGLIDLVEHKGEVKFLVKEGDKLLILPHVKRDGELYSPPPKKKIPWLLPRGEEVEKYYRTDTDARLYDDLLAYHKAVSELPSEEYYDLLVAWDFHSYVLEAVRYTPYIWLFAIPDRGKSRTGKGLIYVAYRGIHVESLREAYLVRLAEEFQGSIFFDVADIMKKAEREGSEDVLLHRYEKGGTVPRVNKPDQPFGTEYYCVFGTTIIATNEAVSDKLESRTIQINMPETERQFENDVTPEGALPLKERLVAFRARHLGESLPDILKPASRRLGDILKPLQQIIRLVKPEREAVFLNLVRQLEEERQTARADSYEAEIFRAVIGLVGAVNSHPVKGDLLAVQAITDKLNERRSEKRQLGSKGVGRKLTAMGFKKEHLENGAHIVWLEDTIELLKKRYGVQQTSETS